MSWMSLNLFTGATLLLFAARIFGYAPDLNLLAILTPALLGEGIAIAFAQWAVRAERRMEAEKRAHYRERLARSEQLATEVTPGKDSDTQR